jgi:membrane protein YqaA with SNARE-associated domain
MNSSSPLAPEKPKASTSLLRWLILIGVIAIIVALFIFRDQVQKLEKYGYLGIFLISIAANATIIIPIPGVAFTTAMGAIFNPVGVAVASGLGAAVGELSGYLAGFSGQGVVERVKFYERIVSWMRSHQILAYGLIVLLGFIPNPLFDMAGMAAGALKLPLWKFLIACALGKILKMLLFAYAGYYSLNWLFPQ